LSGRDPHRGPSIRRRGRALGARDEARSGAGGVAPGLADAALDRSGTAGAAPDRSGTADPGQPPAAPQIRAPASAAAGAPAPATSPRRRRRFVF